MRKTTWALLGGLLAFGAGPAGAQDEVIRPAVQERRIVAFDPGTPLRRRHEMVGSLGLKVLRDLDLIEAVLIEVPLGRLDEVRGRLLAQPGIARVDEDIHQNWLVGEAPSALPALPSLKQALGIVREAPRLLEEPAPPAPQGEEIPWGIKRVNAPEAWAGTAGGGSVVAVVDTGVDGAHPDLAGNFKGGFNAIEPEKPMVDDHGHGSHVAGTVAAVHDSTGVVGVAPSAGVVGVKVLDKYGSGYISDIVAGIEWVVKQGYPIINMSLGGSRGNDSFHEAVKKAVAKGVAVVCAAGNSGAPREGSDSSVSYPARYPEAVAVSASDSSDKLASFSSRGPEVDFIAPGVDVLSTLPDGKYGRYSGTSMASPHMAGLAALAVARGAKGPEEVRTALKAAASPLADLGANEQGSGMVDAAKVAGTH